jgi:hypothetical protein
MSKKRKTSQPMYRDAPHVLFINSNHDSRASTFLRDFFTLESVEQFVIFIIDNNLTHDKRFIYFFLDTFKDMRFPISQTTFFEHLIQIIVNNGNDNFPCDFHNNLYMCYPPYRCFCDIKNGKQTIVNDVVPNQQIITNDFIFRNIFATHYSNDVELWHIYHCFDEFAFCEFLTYENMKNYMIVSFKSTHRIGIIYTLRHLSRLWNDMKNAKYSNTIHDYLLCKAPNDTKMNIHHDLCVFSIYIQFCTEFALRKRVLVALCEEVFENYNHVLAEQVISNMFIIEHIYRFL